MGCAAETEDSDWLSGFIYLVIHATTSCHTFRINKNSANWFLTSAQIKAPPPPLHALVEY